MDKNQLKLPEPIPAGIDVDGIVACGAMLKSTATVGVKDQCYVSESVGDAETLEAIEALDAIITSFTRELKVKPREYACDLHPDFLTTKYAEGIGLPVCRVQHHHAHATACLAEHGLEKALALVYDGTGYGEDGAVWGGEILLAERHQYQRMGHLAYMPMPGVEAAVNFPGRMALGALYGKMGNSILSLCPWMADTEKQAVLQLLETGTNCINTSSMGRLFDCLSALLDICRERTYEGEPAIELEKAADPEETGAYPVSVNEEEGVMVMDGPALLMEALRDVKSGASAGKVATRFHNSVAAGSVKVLTALAEKTEINDVCASGGCFFNKLLVKRLTALCREADLQLHLHDKVTPGDGCLFFGQAVVAGAQRQNSGS